ncbi:methylmalonyl-CoA mutase subunit beta [uncultured Algibacter sp.]|uniref:methylmalonyl-CoA mutase subunit beta n=1 Tax=uncultured Algibacter sp. TaxID=298659 RepID=UPI00260369E6|nr:methylmalonyl-CoA mutase subunit beta [uncultured Algibacter sp.]
MKKTKDLFDEFSAVSSKQWKQKIQYDLNGADYNDTLIWKTNEGILVKPFYNVDDSENYPLISQTKSTNWQICQTIYVADTLKSNKKALDILERGAEAIRFIIPNKDISVKDLIKNLKTHKVSIFFDLQFISERFVDSILKLAPKSKISIDIIGHLVKTGNWYDNLNNDFKNFESCTTKASSISVNIDLYQNAGANMVQQLAYALAHANEYLNRLDLNTTSIEEIIFNVSVGTNYFFEIAKLRALRTLWNLLASEYEINATCIIIACPTKRNKTLYDYNTNMLRTTTECMSAILGGADVVCNLPYDAIYHKDNEFGERIARNQLLVLKHESYFDKVNNQADGSYYIESLTNQLAEKALNLFKNIESSGGFLTQLKEGTIQRKIKDSAHNEQSQFDSGQEVLLGSNKFPNENDTMKNELELYPFVKTNTRKTLIEPIIEKRLAEQLEQSRLKNEN